MKVSLYGSLTLLYGWLMLLYESVTIQMVDCTLWKYDFTDG